MYLDRICSQLLPPTPTGPLPDTSPSYLHVFSIPRFQLEISACMCVGGQPQQHVQPASSHTMKKNDSPFPSSQWLPVALLLGMGSPKFLPHLRQSAVLIFYRCCVDNHSFSEFVSKVAISCPEDSNSQCPIPHIPSSDSHIPPPPPRLSQGSLSLMGWVRGEG